MSNCGCSEIKAKNNLEVIERVAKRLAVAKSKKSSKTEFFVIYECKNGNPDFMDEAAWEKAVSEGTEYKFIKYISSVG
jgi:UDP-N-acetylmuramyl pentapeptide synthase